MNEHDSKNLKDFLKTIEPNLPGYKHVSFSYLAIKSGENFELQKGRLNLQAVPATNPFGHFQSKNLKAGVFRLEELKLSVQDFINSLLSGTLRTPQGDLHFPAEQGQSHYVDYFPYHMEGVTSQRRQIQLNIRGNRKQFIQPIPLDWELKSASAPFFNLQEIYDEYLLGPNGGDFLNVEIIAFNMAAMSTESSVEGVKATLAIDLAEGLLKEGASIGFRVYKKNKVVNRGTIPGANLTWTDVDGVQRGKGDLEVPENAILDCVASYNGEAQSHRWISNPKTIQNPLRSVHDAFDTDLSVLRELIDKSQKKGEDARVLEMAISWLLWLLGFSPNHIGGTNKTSDAPDLIASAPSGNLIVVECTTGILREDSKLSHLFQRAEKIRQSLIISNNRHLRILPVIVTTKTHDEIKAELQTAYDLGVLVITRDDFSRIIDLTVFFPEPERLYTRAEESLRRHQTQQSNSGSF